LIPIGFFNGASQEEGTKGGVGAILHIDNGVK